MDAKHSDSGFRASLFSGFTHRASGIAEVYFPAGSSSKSLNDEETRGAVMFHCRFAPDHFE
jgi:hypothetical protein